MLYAAYCSFHNRSALARSRVAGCYCCVSTFTAASVVAWTHDDSTGLCPLCGIDAVLPDVDDLATLAAAHTRWYGNAATRTRRGLFALDTEAAVV